MLNISKCLNEIISYFSADEKKKKAIPVNLLSGSRQEKNVKLAQM